jgi:hypothetical protein
MLLARGVLGICWGAGGLARYCMLGSPWKSHGWDLGIRDMDIIWLTTNTAGLLGELLQDRQLGPLAATGAAQAEWWRDILSRRRIAHIQRRNYYSITRMVLERHFLDDPTQMELANTASLYQWAVWDWRSECEDWLIWG